MNIGMARFGTWLVVAAIGLLGLVAAVDALRGGEEVRPAADVSTEPTTTEQQQTDTAGPLEQMTRAAVEDLTEEGIEGELVLSDSSCRVRSVVLPSLEERPAPIANGCRLSLMPGSQLVAADGTIPSPDGVVAECTDDGIVVYPRAEEWHVRVRGSCPPSWTPDGRLTVVAGGELREVRLGCLKGGWNDCSVPLLRRADLQRAFGGLPWQMGNPTIREAAWLANDRVAVVVHDGALNLDTLAVFRGRELLGAPPFLYESLADLRTSPRGGYASALLNGRALVLVDGKGEYAPLSGFRSATGITWSPDERWTAIASPDGMFVFGTGSRGSGAVFVPVQANDLVWIGP
jgi:hypothetical protein